MATKCDGKSKSLKRCREDGADSGTSTSSLIPGLPDDVARQCLLRIPVEQFRAAASVSKGWRKEIKSPAFLLQRKALGLSEVLVVLPRWAHRDDSDAAVSGTTPIVYVFKLLSREWLTLPPIRRIPDQSCITALTIIGSELVVLVRQGDHGRHPRELGKPNYLYIYNFLSSSWRRSPDMPEGIHIYSSLGFSYASDSEGMVYISGWTHESWVGPFRTSVAYDVKRDVWMPMPDMARRHSGSKGTFEGGKFHVFSPAQGRHKFEIIETFDPARWSWDEREPAAVEDKAPDIISRCFIGTNWEDRNSAISYYCSNLQQKQLAVAMLEPFFSSSMIQEIIGWHEKMILVGLHENEQFSFVLDSGMIIMDLKTYTCTLIRLPEGHSSSFHSYWGGCCSEI